MAAILGISALYHDAAAALLVDGKIVAAAQEERFTRVKHDARFPQHALEYCLETAGMSASDLDYVAFYDKPITKFVRLLATYLTVAPAGYRSFRKAMPGWVRQKIHIRHEIHRRLGGQFNGHCVFPEHHESHAASAFFPSPFDETAILTVDGVGEWCTTCVGTGRGNSIELLEELRFPHSLGLLYSAFTYYLGFRVLDGEYKVMGLAPYGQPVHKQLILDKLMDLKPDGSFRMDMRYFNYCRGLTMTSRRFHDLFGAPPRRPDSPLTQREMDLAASIQAVTEEILLRTVHHLHRTTGMKNLVMAGGVALNCVANGRILREGPFEDLWIQPAAGDAGGALGAAWFVWHQLLEHPRAPQGRDAQQGSLLGPEYTDQAIHDWLYESKAAYTTYRTDEELCRQVSILIAEGKVVGWFQGRMEFGPRALGARSIFGDARLPTMQSLMNRKIKHRESFRPFASMMLEECVEQVVTMRPNHASPYMLVVSPVQPTIRKPQSPDEASAAGFDKLAAIRSDVPAVTHVDNSTRVQTVDRTTNPLLHTLMQQFYEDTGCPVIINTSMNVRGEPIACSPRDAYHCFMATDMDTLVMGHHLLMKERQPHTMSDRDRRQHLERFARDPTGVAK